MSFIPAFAATVATTGFGDGVFLSADGGTTYMQVMATNKMAYTGQKRNFVDVTNSTSPGAVEEFQGTTQSPGNFTFEIVFLPNDPGQLALGAAYDNNTPLKIAHVYKAPAGYSTGPIRSFTAIVEELPSPGSDVTAATKMNVSLKISGLITKTPAAL